MKINRGQAITFEKLLRNPDGTILPIAKKVDAKIKDIYGTIQWQGPANINYDSGNWQVTFLVPKDAVLSTPDISWTIDWAFTAENGMIIDVISEFDVIEESEEIPDRFILLPEKFESTVAFKTSEAIKTVKLEIINEADQVIFATDNLGDFESYTTDDGYIYEIRMDTGKNRIVSNPLKPHNSHHHHPTIAPGTPGYVGIGFYPEYQWTTGRYIFRFSYTTPNRRGTQYEITTAHVVSNNFWRLYPSVMTVLDKARKKANMVNQFSMSDVHEYLVRGVCMINVAAPQITGWSLSNFPIGGHWWGGLDLSHYLITAACLVGIQSQINMYTDLGFNFSGQTITLDYDPSSALGSMMDSYLTEINTKLPRSKELVLRQTQKTTLVGIRQQFYQHQLSRLDIMRKGLGLAGTFSSSVGQRFLV